MEKSTYKVLFDQLNVKECWWLIPNIIPLPTLCGCKYICRANIGKISQNV